MSDFCSLIFLWLNGCWSHRVCGLGAGSPGWRFSLSWSLLGLLRGRQDGVQGGAFHAWHELNQTSVSDIKNQAVDDLVAEIAMGHLAALEAERCLHLVAFAEKAHSLIFLGLVVVLIDGDRELDLFDGVDFLLLARGAVALVLLIQELAVVLNAADGWNCVRRNLDEIKPAFPGDLQGFEGGQNAKLFAVFVDDADLAGADTFIGADKRLRGTFINWGNKSPPQRVFSLAMRCLGFRCNSP